MRTKLSILILAIVFCANVFSQPNAYSPFSLNASKTSLISTEIRNAVDDAKIINVDFTSVRDILRKKSGSITVRIPFNNNDITLDLKKFDILAPGAKIVGGTETGDRQIDMNSSFVVYTSELKDKNIPLVVITFFDNEVSAIISSGNEISVLARLEKNNTNSDYIFYNNSKLKFRSEFNCGTDGLEMPDKILNMQNNLSGNIKDIATSQLLNANIAIESDYDTFTHFGGTQNAARYILSLFAPVSALYVRDINIKLQSTYLRIWETSADPYTGTTSNVLLNEFRNYWNANMSAVPRTIAHYITTRPGGLGGIAWVNVLCANLNSGYGYAFSDVDGTFNNLPTYSWDVMVVSHETGHNFGSPHTHNCSWPGGPIDSCYAVEGGCYTGPPIARVGTIMSYCHLNGSIALNFGPLPTQLIRTYAESAPCLTNIPGFLVAMPNGGELFRSSQNVVIIWGSDYIGNVNIEYTSNNGSNWNTIQNNVTSTLRTLNWTVPYIPTTQQARIRVYESGNQVNGDQSDSTFQIRPTLIQNSLVDPPQLYSTYVSSGDTSKLHFTFTRSGTLPELKYRWYLSTINFSNNYSQFSNNSGSDSVCSITRGKLDSLMNAWGVVNIGDSLRVKWYVRTFSQFDSLQSANVFLITFRRSVIGIQNISTQIPKEFYVNQNYPNPFNPVTKIKFGLPNESYVKISIYDILGREVAIIASEELKAGEFVVDWNASDFPSGIYFYRIEAGDYVKNSKMILVK